MIPNPILRPLLTTAICCLACVMQAQSIASAPTLSAGLTTVTGQRGELDVELLSQIISEKQEEVKREVLQRKILDGLEGESLALQNFVYSSFYALLSFSDQNAIEKELLKQVSMLALQAGFAEAFLRVSMLSPGLNDTLTEADRTWQPCNFDPLAVDNTLIASCALREALRAYLAEAYQLEDDDIDSAYSKLIPLIRSASFSRLFSIDKHLDQAAGIQRKEDQTRFSAILMDIVYDVVQKNETLQERGFCHIHPSLALRYDALNLYQTNIVRPKGEDERHVPFADLRALIDSSMDLFVDYHPLFFDFVNNAGFTITDLLPDVEDEGDATSVTLDMLLIDVHATMVSLSDRFKERQGDLRLSTEVITDLQSDLRTIESGLDEFRKQGDSIRVYDYYFMRQHVDPLVAKLITLGLIEDAEIMTVQKIKGLMFDTLIKEVDAVIDANKGLRLLDEINFEEYGPLIRIITSLSRLDEVNSYEHIFNTLGQVGINSLGDTRVKFIQDIIYYVEAYASIDRDQNLLNIEVEALLLKLLSLYENRTSSDFQLYFGVGMGQTLDVNYDQGYPLTYQSDGTLDTLGNLAFASEKVGMKLKIINNKRIQSMEENELKWGLPKIVHNPGIHRSQQPIISDVYVFTFGSGLLYNVANLTTAGDNFDHALVGLGGGIAFFNSLDLNIWWAAPMVSGESFSHSLERRTFFGFSFDVKLTEYLSALGEKRRKAQLTN